MAIEGNVIPSKGTWFQPWMCEKIKEVATNGGYVAAMCLAIGIRSRDTFYRWVNEYPEFKEAYEESKLISLARLERLADDMAYGKVKGDFKALALLANNRFREDYTRSASGGTEINIGSINSIESMPSEALQDRIEKLTKKLGVGPVDRE